MTGSSGPAPASHTADSGDTWSDPGSASSISGGSVYCTSNGSFHDGSLPVASWTPPGTDYGAEIVLGATAITAGGVGVGLRVAGASGSQSYYLLQVGPSFGVASVAVDLLVAPSTYTNLISLTGVAVTANDVFGVTVAGSGATVTLTVTHNGTQIATANDTSSGRLVAAGSLGLRVTNVSSGSPDQMRALWAGAIGGPTETITPSSATVALSATQSFTAATQLGGDETFNWAATHGTITGSPGEQSPTPPRAAARATL